MRESAGSAAVAGPAGLPRAARHAVAALVLGAFLHPAIAMGATLGFDREAYQAPEQVADLTVTVVLDDEGLCAGVIRSSESSFAIIPRESTPPQATGDADFTTRTAIVPLGVSGPSPLSIGRVLAGLIIDDALEEGPEEFELELQVVAANLTIECVPQDGSPAYPLPLATGPPATVVILDDDALPTAAIGDLALAEGDAGTTTTFVFPVTLNQPPAAGSTVTVDYATSDGTATTADGDYAAAAGTVTFAAGQTAQTVTVTVNGDDREEADETFFVDLTAANGATIADGRGMGTITNDDLEPPTIDVGDVTVDEGDAGTVAAVFTVSLSKTSTQTVTVDWATRDGTATTADYTPGAGTLTFAPGERSQEIAVDVLGDRRDESDETFFVDLSRPTNATLGDAVGQATIRDDDDVASTVSIRGVAGAEGDSGTTRFNFPVTLSAPSASTVTVRYETRDGTATAETDYVATSGQLTFNPGRRSQTIPVEVRGDQEREADETFFVVLSQVRGATLGDAVATGQIRNDDGGGEPSNLMILAGDNQSGSLNQTLEPLMIEVTDADGEPVVGIDVFWEVVEGDAELASAETVTDEDGVATNVVTLGAEPGLVVVEVSVDGLAQRFTLTAEFLSDDQLAELDDVEQPVGLALRDVCARQNVGGDLRAICNEVAALAPDQLGPAMRAIAPEEVASQGTVSLEGQSTQLRNVEARLAQLRGGGARSAQLTISLPGAAVSTATLADLFAARPAWESGTELLRFSGPGGSQEEEDPATPSAEAGAELGGRLGLFVNGTIGVGKRPTVERENGFDLDTRGLTAGLDYRLRDDLIVGGAVGYLSTETDLSGEQSELQTTGYSLTAYGTYYQSNFYLEGSLGYGRNDLESTRAIDFPGRPRAFALADPDGSQIALSFGGGCETQHEALTVSGFGRVDYLRVAIDGYSERGAPGFNLVVGDQEITSLLTTVGLQFTRAVSVKAGVLLPTFRFGYLHEFEDDSRLTLASFVDDPERLEFAIPTAAPDRDYFNVGLGLAAQFIRGRAAFFFFEKDLDRDDLDYYQVSVGFRFEL